MTLSQFIIENMEAIVAEWHAFALTMQPAAATMSELALRDHAKPILLAIAKDLQSDQTAMAQADKSKGLAPALSTRETAAATHGALRHVSGFDLNQLGAEYRALRASVIRLWSKAQAAQLGTTVVDDLIRFNEAVDQAVAESTARYAAELALSRNTFVAILAHDLRSPLNAITMLSHMIVASEGSGESARQQARQIQSSAREMAALIRDLLEYTRVKMGKGIPVVQSDCDLSTLCGEALDELRAAQPRHVFQLQAPTSLRAWVDRARMRQAVTNLLSNAVQHGDVGQPIGLSLQEDGANLLLKVRNGGKAIPADSLQVIFDPLVQLSADSAQACDAISTSLGLGLFIAREVAQGHGGTIGVESSDGQGTVFTMRLPRQDVAAPSPGYAGASARGR